MRIVTMQRKLAAIFSADVQGYSRLMGENEEVTIHTLHAYRQVMSQLIHQYRGRVVDFAGDNLLAEFASVVDAVQCAVATQQALKIRNATLSVDRAMVFRIGINLGDVVVDGGQIYGEGVNLAARLEGLAEAGGVCIAGSVYDQVETKLDLRYVYLGQQMVKNIARPVRVYRIQLESETSALVLSPPKHPVPARWQRMSRLAVGRLCKTFGRTITLWRGVRRVLLALARRVSRPQRSLSARNIPTVVVLPFDNLSGDPADDDCSTGLTEVLITDLTKLTGTLIVVRNSMLSVTGQLVRVQHGSQGLGVWYILKGSVRKSDHRVRITVQLIDATTGHHVWADRYDRDLHNVFALQDEITQKIVSALLVLLKQHGTLGGDRTAQAGLFCTATHGRHGMTMCQLPGHVVMGSPALP
jgi:adenylate cyclase